MIARSNHSAKTSTLRHAGLNSTMSLKPSPRFLMWVDAVGAFMVCQGDKILLGQALPGNDVDLPIQADVSRRHATIQRDGEGYLLLPVGGPVSVDGRRIAGATILSDGNRIDVGQGVERKFRRPHPLSATARLSLVSHHRTRPPVDAVLLMADSIVLGPSASSHVVARHWSEEIVLFAQDKSLACRRMGEFEIDGHSYRGGGPITADSRVSGEDFSLSLESL